MAKDSGSTATGAATFKPGSPPGVPREVQASFLLWITAVAAGVLETIVRVIDALTVGPSSGGEVGVTGVAIRVIRPWSRSAHENPSEGKEGYRDDQGRAAHRDLRQ